MENTPQYDFMALTFFNSMNLWLKILVFAIVAFCNINFEPDWECLARMKWCLQVIVTTGQMQKALQIIHIPNYCLLNLFHVISKLNVLNHCGRLYGYLSCPFSHSTACLLIYQHCYFSFPSYSKSLLRLYSIKKIQTTCKRH